MVLYMLSKVNFPLTNNQISEFMLDKEYTTYFTLQEIFNDLVNDEFVKISTSRNTTQYQLTDTGRDTIRFFDNKISQAIKEDIDAFLVDNKYDLVNDVSTTSDYYRSTSMDYVVHCVVKEGENNLIELNMSVPTEEHADAMCAKWKDASQEIYEFIIKKLML